MDKILKEYQDYLVKLANDKSKEIFTNAGIHHASILMATMFRNTENRIRMYSTGLKPELITTLPYFDEFNKLFSSDDLQKDIQIMVEDDSFMDEKPFMIVKDAKNKFPDKIKVRLIDPDEKKHINQELGFDHCNFAVFDDAKFRLEYEAEEYKAIGSFNHKAWADLLITLYDKAFNSSKNLLD